MTSDPACVLSRMESPIPRNLNLWGGRGGAEASNYFSAKISENLHEHEEHWAKGGEGWGSKCLLCRFATDWYLLLDTHLPDCTSNFSSRKNIKVKNLCVDSQKKKQLHKMSVYILVNCHRRQMMSHLSILFTFKLCNKMRKGDILYENDQLTIF